MKLVAVLFLALLAGCASSSISGGGFGPERVQLVADSSGGPPPPESAPSEKVAPEESGSSVAEMARKLQDPLANIAAIMTDNDILFGTGKDDVSYSFQIQPVKAWAFEDEGFNFIARGVIPVLGIAGGGQIPPIGDPTDGRGGYTWGLGDIVSQFFFSPRTEGGWKWGAGPQISWRTATDDDLRGPGWGAGPTGILVGNLTKQVSVAIIGGHLWSFQNSFSTSLVQPMVYYNFESVPGLAVAYNAPITYDWSAKSGNALTLPLGAAVSKTFDMGGGHGLEVSVGPYWNVVKPDGAADWQVKFTIAFLFP